MNFPAFLKFSLQVTEALQSFQKSAVLDWKNPTLNLEL
jgi:hypothetical protein